MPRATRSLVPSASRAALAAGADGLLIEVIGDEAERDHIRCDGQQGIRPDAFRDLMASLR